MTAQKITLTICADQRTGHADTYIGIGAVEHITVTGIEVPDGTAIALVALDGAIMGLGHTVSNAAEVITATETAFKRFEFLDADRAEPAVIAVGDTNNLIATVQVLCRRNYLNGATPPAIDIPIYPTGPELEAILAQMRKEAEAAKKSADAAKQSEDGALSARSDALLAANAAGQSAQNAASSAANAALYRNQAQIYARNAKKSEDAAKDAAFWADLSKQDAEARASEAADSAAAAYRSEKAAKTAETNAASSATAASGSVTAAAAEASKAETAAADAANAAQEASTSAATATEAADAAGAFAEEARAEANRAEQAAAGVPALLDGKSDYLDVDATLSAERGPERFVINGRYQYDKFNPAKTTFTGWMMQGTRTNVGDGKSGTIDHVFWGAGKDKNGKALFRRGAFSDEVTAGLSKKQDTLTAGDGITLEGGIISATGGGGVIVPSIDFRGSTGDTSTYCTYPLDAIVDAFGHTVMLGKSDNLSGTNWLKVFIFGKDGKRLFVSDDIKGTLGVPADGAVRSIVLPDGVLFVAGGVKVMKVTDSETEDAVGKSVDAPVDIDLNGIPVTFTNVGTASVFALGKYHVFGEYVYDFSDLTAPKLVQTIVKVRATYSEEAGPTMLCVDYDGYPTRLSVNDGGGITVSRAAWKMGGAALAAPSIFGPWFGDIWVEFGQEIPTAYRKSYFGNEQSIGVTTTPYRFTEMLSGSQESVDLICCSTGAGFVWRATYGMQNIVPGQDLPVSMSMQLNATPITTPLGYDACAAAICSRSKYGCVFYWFNSNGAYGSRPVKISDVYAYAWRTE